MTDRITELRQLQDRLATLADEVYDEDDTPDGPSARLRKAAYCVENAIEGLRERKRAGAMTTQITVKGIPIQLTRWG